MLPVLIGIRCYHSILISSSLSETKYLFIHLYGLFLLCEFSAPVLLSFAIILSGCLLTLLDMDVAYVSSLSAACLHSACFFVVHEGSLQQCLSCRLQFLFVIPSFVIRVAQSLSEGLSGTALFCSLESFV